MFDCVESLDKTDPPVYGKLESWDLTEGGRMEPARVLDFGQKWIDDGTNEQKRFRETMHRELDKFLDQMTGVFEEERRQTLAELSDTLTQKRGDFLGACLQHLLEERYSDELNREESPCPYCGKLCRKRRDVTKKLQTMQGPCELKRPWFYCASCGRGFVPLDTEAELSRREKQFDLQKRAVKLAAQLPFECASEVFEDLTGQRMSDHFIHDLFEEVGVQATLEAATPSKEEISKRIEQASMGKWRPVLVVASDGAHLPTRPKAGRDVKRGPGKYKEAKGFRIYLVGKERITHIASWHQIQNEERFGVDLALAAERIPRERVRIALLGDGAEWLWKHMRICFPEGREVLDFYHCSQHVHEVARVQYGEKSSEAIEWVEATLCRLCYGEVGHVIAGLRRMKPKTAQADELIRKLVAYLQQHRHRIDYRSLRLGGYPIGSGGIESANKFICHTRMKRSGAWWVKATGNLMLGIRCAIYNGTYDHVFGLYKQSCLPLAGEHSVR